MFKNKYTNIFVMKKRNICIRILNIRCLIFEYLNIFVLHCHCWWPYNTLSTVCIIICAKRQDKSQYYVLFVCVMYVLYGGRAGLHKTWYPGNGVTSQSIVWQPKWLASSKAQSVILCSWSSSQHIQNLAAKMAG